MGLRARNAEKVSKMSPAPEPRKVSKKSPERLFRNFQNTLRRLSGDFPDYSRDFLETFRGSGAGDIFETFSRLFRPFGPEGPERPLQGAGWFAKFVCLAELVIWEELVDPWSSGQKGRDFRREKMPIANR